jgi:threonine aldolase
VIDLRSDTVTRPTPAMLAAMARVEPADTGDDVYDEDRVVHALQERVASMLGQEAALFTVTGSLSNLLAVRALAPAGTEVLCDAQAHIVRAELGAHAAVLGTTTRTWASTDGVVDPAVVEAMIAPDLGPFIVATSALSVENTHNFGGGTVQPLGAIQAIRALADARGLRVHMDGARLWNASVATGVPLEQYGAAADVVTVSLSKGLGAPIGSLLAGPADLVADARVWRKRLGGGWRQAGVLAAAAMYALDHHLERIAEDHANAALLAEACGIDPAGVATNIVVVPCEDAPSVVVRARAAGVLTSAVGPRILRLVTHLDVTEADARKAADVLAPLVQG